MEQAPNFEKESVLAESMVTFAKSFPSGQELDWKNLFDKLDQIPGSGGPDLIAGIAKIITDKYKEVYGISL